ncbi:MAG: hypothetical protein HDS31_07840 [Bacteroides sp.]|nr:hypothetical protein [Bacteroides sp.]
MKSFKIFSIALCALSLLGSCTAEDMPGKPGVNEPGVHLTLGGAAAKSLTRAATEAAADEEKDVRTLHAVLFDTHEGFYDTVEARKDGDGWSFIVEKDATYEVYLVANANEALITTLRSIDKGTKADDAEKGLESVIANQAPGEAYQFLMLSKYPQKVTTRITETENLGEVRMERLAARFDIVNQAEGVTVDKVTLNNRTVRSSLVTRNLMPSESYWFENESYTVDLAGDKEEPAKCERVIYSYENYSGKETNTVLSMTVEYTEKGVRKTHEVEFIDPAKKDRTPLAIKRNNLYRVVLTKAGKLDFDLQVADWDAPEALEATDLRLDLPADEQEELNKRLLVYDLFTEYNVKSLDKENRKVTFYDELAPALEDCDPSSYFNYQELWDAGICQNGTVLTDEAGNEYRLPTSGELKLLMPLYSLSNNMYGHLLFTITRTLNKEIKENITLKNKDDGYKATAEYSNVTSYLALSKNDYPYVHPTAGPSYERPCYGIRFKNTDQYSAYRWEIYDLDNNMLGISIKIKALPIDSDITIEDIIDNVTFWKDNYIEINIPFMGYFSPLASEIKEFGIASTLASSSTLKLNNNVRFCDRARVSNVEGYVGTQTENYGMTLRLVKVKNEAQPEGQE